MSVVQPPKNLLIFHFLHAGNFKGLEGRCIERDAEQSCVHSKPMVRTIRVSISCRDGSS